MAMLLMEIHLRLIALEASNNGNEVVLDITSRFIQEILIKPNLPGRVVTMRRELKEVRRDLAAEVKVAKKAKQWLLRTERHRPKTGHDGLDEMFP